MTNLATRVNDRAWQLCTSAIEAAEWLDIRVTKSGALTVLDFGSDRVGQIASGLLLARICLADLATVRLSRPGELGLPQVEVTTDHPLWACLAAQYAGWAFSVDDYFAMGSGPARMGRGQEELLDEYGLVSKTENVVGVFETKQIPNPEVCETFLRECSAKTGMFCVSRTASLPGTLQVVARSIETTMHKLHELKFDLRKVKNAFGSAPLPPIGKNDLTALGWTNDAILYGAEVVLWVDASDEELQAIGEQVPSCHSKEFGRPFIEIFEKYDRDFYKIDKMLFSPAKVTFQSLQTGNSSTFGAVRTDLLAESFGLPRDSTP